jgi:tetratricopeptide (TPR) repeat protein
MQIPLDSSARKVAFATGILLLSFGFLTLCARDFLASLYSNRPDLRHLQRAVRLDPSNGAYHVSLARYLVATGSNPAAAAEEYRTATRLNPHDAQAWFELAGVAQVLDDISTQREALQQAIAMDPTTPELAWQAGSFFLVQGEQEKALKQFRVVGENEPPLATQALDLATHAADVDTVIREVLPPQPDAYLEFLTLLMSKKDTVGAAKVWSGLAQLGKPIDRRHALGYVNYLILQKDVNGADTAWRQTLRLAGLSGYATSSENLIVNPSFDSEILNSGFDWHYNKEKNVTLALDPTDFHAGNRSLSIVFDGPAVNDAGIFQFIPVEPERSYEFSAYYKTLDMDGVGGPRFSISDAYTGATYYLSDDLTNADTWRQADGSFKTSSETQLLLLRVLRIPAGSPIRGRVWIDEFHLAEKKP